MKLKYFQKKMQKPIFSTREAQLVAFQNNPSLVNLQLHQWVKAGELVTLKKGLYVFAGYKPSELEVAKNLYTPCYFSLEYILNRHNIIPETVFTYTLVTTKSTRTFDTPFGRYYYRTIKKQAFTGFDPKTLMAEKEKALVDYFYLNSQQLKAENLFWEESRLEAVETEINFKKVFHYAKLFNSKRLVLLLNSYQKYAKSHQAGK